MIFNSVAYEAGVKNRDFVVEVNGTKVFEMSQDEFKELIKKAGDQIHLKVERYIMFHSSKRPLRGSKKFLLTKFFSLFMGNMS